MRGGLTLLALCAFLLLNQPASAILLIETGSKKRVVGFWEKEDAKQISVRIKGADGKEEIKVFDHAKIKILHQVDRPRLGKLSKDKPKAYRDYADELANVTNDPEAVELATRLYLIAANLDPANLGRSCLMSMSALATRPADIRKYRAMAFLLDAKAEAGMLKVDATKVAPTISPDAKASLKALTEFQKALRSYRSGDLKRAKEHANEKGVADYFAKAGIKDQKSFLQACSDAVCGKCRAGMMTCPKCMGKKFTDEAGFAQPCTACNGKGTQKCTYCDGFGVNPVPEDYLKVVLKAEIWAIEQVLPSDPSAKRGTPGGWSSAVSNPQASIPLMTLESISEFDPRKCVFRNGLWEAP